MKFFVAFSIRPTLARRTQEVGIVYTKQISITRLRNPSHNWIQPTRFSQAWNGFCSKDLLQKSFLLVDLLLLCGVSRLHFPLLLQNPLVELTLLVFRDRREGGLCKRRKRFSRHCFLRDGSFFALNWGWGHLILISRSFVPSPCQYINCT